MKSYMKRILLSLPLFALFFLSACKDKDPSVLKVFVRSYNNELLQNARVIIVADQFSNPATPPHVDTVLTNSSGYALFNMDEFFEGKKKEEATGYFDIKVKRDLLQGVGYVRCRAHITAVETVAIQ